VVLARSVAAYLLAALDQADLDKVSRTLNQHTTKAIMTIFRFVCVCVCVCVWVGGGVRLKRDRIAWENGEGGGKEEY